MKEKGNKAEPQHRICIKQGPVLVSPELLGCRRYYSELIIRWILDLLVQSVVH